MVAARYGALLSEFARYNTLIRFDPRGSGLSDRVLGQTLDEFVLDIEAVVGRTGFREFALVAVQLGTPAAIAFAARHAEQVSRFAIGDGFARMADLLNTPQSRTLTAAAQNDWVMATEAIGYVVFGSGREESRDWGAYIRSCIGPEAFAPTYLDFVATWDASDLAPMIGAPTLIVKHQGVQVVTMEMAKDLATLIPNAQFAIVQGTWADNPEVFARRMIAFVNSGVGDAPPAPELSSSGLTAILFADIVDSTALTERLGDAAFREKARELDGTLRSVIREHAGTPIEGKLLGDGVLAVFTSARQAIEAPGLRHRWRRGWPSAPPRPPRRRRHSRGQQRLRRRRQHRLTHQRSVRAGRSAGIGDGALAGADIGWRAVRGPRRAGGEGRRRAGAGVGGGGGGGVMEQPRIQYAKTSDGVSIAVCTLGEGHPLVFLPVTNSIGIEGLWQIPGIRRNLERLAEGRRVVLYDGRGVGLSTRDVEDLSTDASERDLEAVVDGLGMSTVDLLVSTFAGPFANSFAAHRPDRVRKLILVSTVCRGRDFHPPRELRDLRNLVEINWELYLQTQSLIMYGWTEEGRRWAEGLVSDVNKDAYLKSFAVFRNSDASNLLPQLACRTLVMHWRERQAGISIETSKDLAAAIPNARFLTFSRQGGMTLFGDWDSTLAPVVAFLDDDLPRYKEPQLPSGTAIILFADIADSTALTEHLGDAAFRAKARDLDGALREVIREHAGTAIEGKLLGDGVLAVFTSARQAIEAALACGKAGGDAGLPLHLGIHAGDVIREENNVYGGAVNIASRISGLSAAGEVLVSDVVRTLARTSAGVRFEDRGEQKLKGVGEAVRVWVVAENQEPRTENP